MYHNTVKRQIKTTLTVMLLKQVKQGFQYMYKSQPDSNYGTNTTLN